MSSPEPAVERVPVSDAAIDAGWRALVTDPVSGLAIPWETAYDDALRVITASGLPAENARLTALCDALRAQLAAPVVVTEPMRKAFDSAFTACADYDEAISNAINAALAARKPLEGK